MTLYFAYGDNMDPAHMARHAPAAVRLGAAELMDHSIGVGAAGFATVRPEPGASVHGVLWRLTDADEDGLDRYEDVAGGFYSKETVPVRTGAGEVLDAMIYRAVNDVPGLPDRDYFDRLIGNARTAGLPAAHIARLHALRGG